MNKYDQLKVSRVAKSDTAQMQQTLPEMSISGKPGEVWKSSYRRIHEFFIHLAFLSFLKRESNTGIPATATDDPNVFAATAQVIQSYLIKQRTKTINVVEKTDNLMHFPDANITAIHEDGVRKIMKANKDLLQQLPSEEQQLQGSFDDLLESALSRISDTSLREQVRQHINEIKRLHMKFIKQYVIEALEGQQEIDLTDIHETMKKVKITTADIQAREQGRIPEGPGTSFKHN